MAFKLPAYLHRNRYGTLYLRLTVPVELRPMLGRAEIYRSLETNSVKQASIGAQTLRISLLRIFKVLTDMGDGQIDEERQRRLIAIISQRRLDSAAADFGAELEEKLSSLAAVHRRELEVLHERAKNAALTAHGQGFQKGLAAVTIAPPPNPGPLLSEALEAYVRAQTAKAVWNEKTEATNRAAIALLIEHVGDRPIEQVDSEMIIDFHALLRRLPSNLTKLRQKQGRTLPEMAALGLSPLTPRTVGNYMSRISSMFKWCCKSPKFPITYNPAEELAKGKKQSTFERRPFTAHELTLLFSSREFVARQFRDAFEYWLMPLGIYTGARLGELCQLSLVDFVTVDGVECIDINEDRDGKTLKNDNAKRLVPIHSQLIALGLLRYVDQLRRAGKSRLFPELSLVPTSSHHASKWFNEDYRRRNGVSEKQTTVFHSFRHGFITHLLDHEDGIAEHQIAPIVGHEAKLITGKVYWNKKDAKKRQPIVEAFQLHAAVRALIPVVECVTFGKGPMRAHPRKDVVSL
jgi:integrase